MERKGRLWLGSVVLLCALGRAEGADPYEEAWARAKGLEAAGKWKEAERAFGEALGKQGPKHLRLKVAEMRVKQGRGEAALREVEEYRRQEPGAKKGALDKAAEIEGKARALIAAKVEDALPRKPEVAESELRPALVRIEPGTFWMGSPETEKGGVSGAMALAAVFWPPSAPAIREREAVNHAAPAPPPRTLVRIWLQSKPPGAEVYDSTGEKRLGTTEGAGLELDLEPGAEMTVQLKKSAFKPLLYTIRSDKRFQLAELEPEF